MGLEVTVQGVGGMVPHLGVHHGVGAALHVLLRPAHLQQEIAHRSQLVQMTACNLLLGGFLMSEPTVKLCS